MRDANHEIYTTFAAALETISKLETSTEISRRK